MRQIWEHFVRPFLVGSGIAFWLLFLGIALGHARDPGYPDTSPKVRQWYQSLMQPDAPSVSCCGEADAYEADDFEIDGDQYVAIITDERDDVFPSGARRTHIDPGTRIKIPNAKLKFDAGGTLYCYVAPGGA